MPSCRYTFDCVSSLDFTVIFLIPNCCNATVVNNPFSKLEPMATMTCSAFLMPTSQSASSSVASSAAAKATLSRIRLIFSKSQSKTITLLCSCKSVFTILNPNRPNPMTTKSVLKAIILTSFHL